MIIVSPSPWKFFIPYVEKVIKVSEVGVINLRTHNFGLLCKALLLVVALVGGHGMILHVWGAPFDFQGHRSWGGEKFGRQVDGCLFVLFFCFCFWNFLFTHQMDEGYRFFFL